MKNKLKEKDKSIIREFASENGAIPGHIAIIMDGNGRWARQRGLPRVEGHRRGVETVRQMVETCALLNVKHLTLYTFSTENWKRPQDEVSTLMRLVVKSLQNETNELHANNVRLSTIGDMSSLPNIVQNEILQATGKTSGNTGLNLNLALSYSGRWELVEAARKIAEKCANGELHPEDINEELFASNLNDCHLPDPDLLIRSGGEMRVSNFLLWQIAYSEIYVTKTLWPEFNYKSLIKAIEDYQKRERRFGLVSEQITQKQANIQNAKKFSNQIA